MPVSSVPLSETHTSGRPRDDGLELAQDRDDLLFGEPAPLHPPSPNPGYGLYPFLDEIPGLRSARVNTAKKNVFAPLRATDPPEEPEMHHHW